ncbi:MAG: hypothetical protein RMJ33_12275 [Saprospiraceae bacterium]|nr:hypothetical protein [Saprospiraceae bacterium]MDW8230604.1 hypothetical protein [Saprospiraceae bacterium]
MEIANPLYDAAFKYLMSNPTLARKVLSIILDKEVVSLKAEPQEIVSEGGKQLFSLYRMDYRAIIRDADGREEEVHIELQKWRATGTLKRFRTYLSQLYSHQRAEAVAVAGVEEPQMVYSPRPIITIYILGYNVLDIPHLAVRFNHCATDLTTKEKVEVQSDFIDLLTHTTYVIQLRRLPLVRQTPLERLLTLFDQRWAQPFGYILDLPAVPQGFEDIAEYLRLPLLDAETRRKLAAEQWAEIEFAEQETEIFRLQEAKEDALKREAEAQKMVAEARQIAQQAQAQLRAQALKFARYLLNAGASPEEVARETGLSEAEVRDLLNK